ncbi:hypothetical protein BBK82_00010 [Lentzea guizhouensis]|uniref:Uncharacterized protein n=1 Tax=Lentzea guizhouensis TaxID=1586287 RepID=A0A1B2HAF1_9PSEU|nr:hypothetical protein [Lentzea guizhouensis]ANZ34702.1 hypothetical protein BBK82_00010 [Lentzea guizhouensis]
MGKVLGALVGLVLCAACAPTVEVVPPPPPDPPGLTVAAGPCQVEEQIPEPVAAPPADPSPRSAPTGGAAPDVAPHNAENNAWKQRRSLSADAVQAGRDLITRVLPVLEPLCASGDLSAGPVRKALSEHRAYVEQRPTLVFFSMETRTVQRVTCLNGDMSAGKIRLFVQGTTGEGTCVEPVSH